MISLDLGYVLHHNTKKFRYICMSTYIVYTLQLIAGFNKRGGGGGGGRPTDLNIK